MHSTISPYELLCQSKPRQAPTFVTPYDLYSSAGQSGAHAAPPDYSSSKPEPALPDKPAAFKHTHYISDIHSKHSAAGKKAVLSSVPLK